MTIDSTDNYQGLFGYIGTNGQVMNVGVTGNITGRIHVGGIAGSNSKGTITNCYNTGSINGGGSVGGVMGYNEAGTITNCYYCTDIAGSAKGAINGSDTETCKGLTAEQMTGANALENMVFTSEAGTWVTLANETEPDENGMVDCYFPQLSVFVSDPANPQPEEMPTMSFPA